MCMSHVHFWLRPSRNWRIQHLADEWQSVPCSKLSYQLDYEVWKVENIFWVLFSLAWSFTTDVSVVHLISVNWHQELMCYLSVSEISLSHGIAGGAVGPMLFGPIKSALAANMIAMFNHRFLGWMGNIHWLSSSSVKLKMRGYYD